MASENTIARLTRAASIIRSGPGALMSQADNPRVAVVLRGTIAGILEAPDGRTVYVGLYGPGQVNGVATLAGGPIAVGTEALTEVTLLAWESRAFRQIAIADTAMLLDLLDRAIFAVHVLNHLIKVQTFTGARSRVAALLLRYEPFCCGRDPLVPRSNLSALAAVTSRMVSTILRDWEAAGIVRRLGRTGLEIVDRSALATVAAPLDAFSRPDRSLPGAWTDPDPRSLDRSLTAGV
ncbi:MAG: Crp/Fnr family transcriptional regulator [Chloroflexota bacterium]